MPGIYQFKIEGYGIYVSQSYEPATSLMKQCEILSAGTHHCFPLQRLWNLHYDLVSYSLIQIVPNMSILSLAVHAYRRQFPFTIDSAYRSSIVEHNKISRRYTKYKFICLEVDHDGFVEVYDDKLQKIGLEVGVPGLQSGYYRITGKDRIRRVLYGIS